MADMYITVGVDTTKASYEQFQKDLNTLVSQIQPPVIRVRLEIDQSQISALRSQLSEIRNLWTSSGGRNNNSMSQQIVSMRTAYQTLAQAQRMLNKNPNMSFSGTFRDLREQASTLQGVLARARQQSITVEEAFQQMGRNGAVEIERMRTAIAALNLNIEETGRGGSVNMKQMYTTFAQMSSLINNNSGTNITSLPTLQQQATQFAETIRLVEAGGISLGDALKKAGLDGSTAITNAQNAMARFRAEMVNTNGTESQRQAALKRAYTLLTQLENAEKKWTKAKNGKSAVSYRSIQGDVAALNLLIQQYKTGEITLMEFEARVKSMNTSFTTNANQIRAVGEATQGTIQRVKALMAKFSQWFGITRVIMAIYQGIRSMITNVVELDTAMTELKKVTDETDSAYNRFLENATARAKKLGASLTDIVNASADFARLGYNIQDAEKLADVAIMYKNVGDGIESIDEASESIIATMQGFELTANDAESIVDKFNNIGNNFAISSGGIGEALLRSAAAMNSAGNTLDETIALSAAANTVVQDPDKVGTTLKTVSMYLRAAKTDAENAGESTDGMANSVSELRSEILALTGNRVDIQLDDDTFKSTYQILKELATVWDDLSDISQANILEMVGGKRNANVVAALLENFSVAEEALGKSLNSMGSAAKENEKYLDSIQGRIQIFRASFEDLSQKVFDSDLIKFVVSSGTTIIDTINKLIDSIGLLGTALLGLGIYKGTTGIAGWGSGIIQMSKVVQTLSASGIHPVYNGATGDLTPNNVMAYTNAIVGLNAEQAKLVLGTQGLTSAQQQQILTEAGLIATSDKMSARLVGQALAQSGLSDEKQREILASVGLMDVKTNEIRMSEFCTEAKLREQLAARGIIGAEQDRIIATILGTNVNAGFTLSFDVLTGAIVKAATALWSFLTTNPVGWAIMAVAAISAVAAAYDSYRDSKEDALRDNIDQTEDELSKLNEELATLEQLSGRLSAAKDNKLELVKVQQELNAVIGDTPGLLNAEGKAYEQATAKLEAKIAAQKCFIKQNKKSIVDSKRSLYNDRQVQTKGIFGWDWAKSDVSGDDAREWRKLQITNNMTDEDFSTFTGIIDNDQDFKASEWQEYWEEQGELACEIFEDTIAGYTGVGGQDFATAFIKGAASSGYTIDEISNVIDNVLNSSSLQNTIDTYWESLIDPNINSEGALTAVCNEINTIITRYPELTSILNEYYDSIVVGGRAVSSSMSTITQKSEHSASGIISSAQKMDDAFEQISNILNDIKDGGSFDYSAVFNNEDFKNTFSGLGDVYENFVETIAQSPNDIVACKNAVNQLMTAYLHSSGILNKVTEENKDAIITYLKQMGVSNAVAIVERELAIQREKSANAAKVNSAKTNDEIIALINEAGASDEAKQALFELAMEKLRVNQNQIITSGDIDQIIALGNAAGVTAAQLSALARAKAVINEVESGSVVGFKYLEYGQYDDAVDILEQIANGTYIFEKVDYSPYDTGSGSSSGLSSGSSSNSALDAYLEGAEWSYKAHQNELKYINDLEWALNNLVKTDEERFDILNDIEQARKDYADNRVKDIEHEIEMTKYLQGEEANVIDFYKEIQTVAHDEANRLRSLGYTDQSDEIQEWQKTWWDAEENKRKLFESQSDKNTNARQWEADAYERSLSYHERFNKQLENELESLNDISEKYYTLDSLIENTESIISINVEKRNKASEELDKLFENVEFKTLTDKYKFNPTLWFNADGNLNSQYEKDLSVVAESDVHLIKEYAEGLEIWKKAWVEADDAITNGKNSLDDYYEKQNSLKIDTFLEAQGEAIEILDFRYNKEAAIIEALRKQNDLKQEIREKQTEINAELEASKHLEGYLDENTRKGLFNDEDYSKLSKKLNGVNREVTKLYRDYRNEINNLSRDEWYKEAEITAQFQARLDVQMETYELLEKELELTKERTKLENISKQRNTRVMVAGRWVQTADPKAMYEQAQAVAQAEAEKENITLTNAENATVRAMEAVNNATNTQKLAMENNAKMIEDMTEEQKAAFAKTLPPIETLEGMLTVFGGYNVPMLNNAVADVIKAMSSFSGKEYDTVYSPTTDYMSGMQDIKSVDNSLQSIIVIDEMNGKRDVKIDDTDSNYEKISTSDFLSTSNSGKHNISLTDFMQSRWGIGAEGIGTLINTGLGVASQVVSSGIPSPTTIAKPENPSYSFTFGDFIIKEKIDNADDLIYAFTDKLSTCVDLNKNKR